MILSRLLVKVQCRYLSKQIGYGLSMVLSLLSYNTLAQKIWTIQECLAFSHKNNIVQQAGLTRDRSFIQLKTAKKIFLPTIDARIRTATNWGFIIDPSTNALSDRFNLSNQAALNLNLDLVNGLANSHQIKLRDQELIVANYEYDKSLNTVTLDVIYSFLQVSLAREQLRNSKQRIDYLDKQQKKVKSQVEKGILNKRDLLNLQSLVAAEELLSVCAENHIEKALFNLKHIMGIDLIENILVDTYTIPDNWFAAEINIDEVVAASVAISPDLKAAQAKVGTAYKLWQLERTNYMPVLSLAAQIATRTSNYRSERFSEQLSQNLNRQVSLSLYIPIFNRFMVRSTDQMGRLDLMSSKLMYQQASKDYKEKIINFCLDYRSAARKFKTLQIQLKAAEEEHRYAEKMLELQVIDPVEYSAIRGRLVTAQSELLQAKYDCFFKQKVLTLYEGNPLEF